MESVSSFSVNHPLVSTFLYKCGVSTSMAVMIMKTPMTSHHLAGLHFFNNRKLETTINKMEGIPRYTSITVEIKSIPR